MNITQLPLEYHPVLPYLFLTNKKVPNNNSNTNNNNNNNNGSMILNQEMIDWISNTIKKSKSSLSFIKSKLYSVLKDGHLNLFKWQSMHLIYCFFILLYIYLYVL
ncbi:hypothetical protein ACTFIU_007389 [Dictyostelium citrinum]